MKQIMSVGVIVLLLLSNIFSVNATENCVVTEGTKYDNVSEVTYSPNGKSIAYVAQNDGKYFVVKDGVEGKKYDGIESLTYSGDGKSFAYTAQEDGKNIIVKDGIEGKKYDGYLRDLYFLEKTQALYAIIEEETKAFFIIDGIEGKKYSYKSDDYYGFHIYSISETSQAILVQENGKEFIVKDGVEGKKYASIFFESIVYSDTGTKIAYVAQDNGIMAVSDNYESKKYEELGYDTIKFSLNGESITFLATDNPSDYADKQDGRKLIFKNKEYNIGFKLDYFDYVMSPDGKQIAYIKNEGDGSFVIKDGMKSKKYDNISGPAYSKNGKSFAFIAQNDGKYFIVKDGVEGKKHTNKISYFVFSGDGGISYVIEDGEKQIMVINGIEGKKYDGIHSPSYIDSSVVYEIQENGKAFFVKNGVELPGNTIFSPDGKSVAYVMEKEGKQFIVKDGVESQKYNASYGINYSSDGKNFSYVAEISGKKMIVQEMCNFSITQAPIKTISKTKVETLREVVNAKNEVRKLVNQKTLTSLDSKLSSTKLKVQKQSIEKQKIILQKLFDGLVKLNKKYTDKSSQVMIKYLKVYFEHHFYDVLNSK